MTYEYAGNLHAHTLFSDGYATHDEVALAAIQAALDFVVLTDHNVLVQGLDGYRYHGSRRVLLVAGEEIHDQVRVPQKNHLLVYEARTELASLAPYPQRLLDAVGQARGLAFLAHPVDPASSTIREPDLSWVDWDLQGYAGLEIWNTMSEFKGHLTSVAAALFYAYNPTFSPVGPFPQALARWDSLLSTGRRVVGIGGADAHATPVRAGPLRRVVLPYPFLFRAVNTHVLTETALTGDTEEDRRNIFAALRQGHCFVGYDLPASTRGFLFTASGDDGQALMGDAVRGRFGVTLQVHLPQPAELRLVHNGEVIRRWAYVESAVCVVTSPGAYRVEARRLFRGRLRGWIFSNPIYVTS